MQNILAFDAGGTSTRAVILDRLGSCLGYGRGGSGNPVSSGFTVALASLRGALEGAAAQLGTASGGYSSAVIAMAGSSVHTSADLLSGELAALGLRGSLVIEADLLATFFSGTFHVQGYALVAGTGAVGARIKDGRLDAVADGMGWLLGDAGSGFWIGHHVVRAVTAAVDGRGPRTLLTAALMDALGIDPGLAAIIQGRPVAAQQMVDALYDLRPVELARFAPLAFEAAQNKSAPDPVAREILEGAARALSGTLGAVIDPSTRGPVVFGGSILSRDSPLASSVERSLPGPALEGAGVIRVADGVVGAAVLALRHAGVTVDAAVYSRIGNTLAALRGP
ncbi:MAG: N-acetylglucosamine kinase [Actinomycetota bacterium]|nr:N-acetylglucosamine kinase [Actinomycetota bacterium]